MEQDISLTRATASREQGIGLSQATETIRNRI
jgi:hypothetical protein